MSNNHQSNGIPGGTSIGAMLKKVLPTKEVKCDEDVMNEEQQYWAKKLAIEAFLEDPEIVYEIEGNRCVCRQKQ